MKAVSIKQPWAWAILNAGKRIENRSRVDGVMPAMCSHRGPLLLCASKGVGRRDEFDEACEILCSRVPRSKIAGFVADIHLNDRVWVPAPGLDRGGIVGVCNVVDAVHTTLGGHRWHARDDRTCLLCGGSVDERAPRCAKPKPC